MSESEKPLGDAKNRKAVNESGLELDTEEQIEKSEEVPLFLRSCLKNHNGLSLRSIKRVIAK